MAKEKCINCGFSADNIIDNIAGIYHCPVCGEMKSIVHEACQYCEYYKADTNECIHPQSYKLNALVHSEFWCSNFDMKNTDLD